MFKTMKKFTSCLLVLCMMLSLAPMDVFATETETINYVSIGDSMTNGYCFDGYNQGGSLPDFINDNDNGVYGDVAYPELVADWLEGNYATVNHTRLAPSAMRAEDLLYLLGGRATPADDWYGEVQNYTNCYDDAALSEFFTDSVENADLITMGIGNASFGAFLLQHVTDAIGVMGAAPSIDPDITLANALTMLDAEQQEVIMQAHDYLTEELGKYISDEMAARFNIPAVLDITAYTAASFILSYKGVIERIMELNDDAEIILVGLMNTTYGMTITADGMDPIPFGDIMDNVFGLLNTYIAGLPAAMQAAGNNPDAKFYYTDIDEIEFIVQRFDDLRDDNWEVADDGLSGEIVRARTITSYSHFLRDKIADGIGMPLSAIDYDDVVEYEGFSTWLDVVTVGKSTEVATSVAIYLAIEDALAASVGEMNIPLNDLMSIAGGLDAVFSDLNPDNTSPAALRATLGAALSADSLKPLCKIFSLFKIGDGMSVHPTPVAHAALAAKIISAYENGYTAEDKIIDTAKALVELIAKYGKDAVEKVYAYAESNGYIELLKDKVVELKDAAYAKLVEAEPELRAKYEELIAKADELLVSLETEIGKELPTANEIIDAIIDYENTLAQIKDYIENDAEIQELIAEVENIIAQIKDIIANPEIYIQNIIDDVVAKYKEILEAATTADYVACGENHYVAFAGTNTSGNEEYEYSFQVSDYIDAYDNSYHHFTEYVSLPDMVDYIKDMDSQAVESLKKATVITYQTDAKSIVLPVFDGAEVTADDWAALLDVDAEKAAEIKAIILALIKGEYADEATGAIDFAVDKVSEIKAKIMAELPAVVLEKAEEVKNDEKVDEIIEEVLTEAYKIANLGIDDSLDTVVDMVVPYAERLVFNTVAYLVNNIKAVEAIKAINPDSLIAVVGLHNPVNGLMISVDGQVVDLGEYVDYFVEATNVYNTIYAAANENVIFVEADETAIAGYESVISIDTSDLDSIGRAFYGLLPDALEEGTVVTEAGHDYIANQIKAAITKVNHIDSDNDDICDKCGEDLAPVTPTPTPRPVGGGSGSSQITVKFDTNGGSVVESVVLDKGALLAEPAAPTKSGYIFGGWYVDKALTSKYDFSTPVTKSFTLYAKWISTAAVAKFTDLDADAWYYKYVITAVEKGLMNGISDTLFAPDATLTRGMFVTILHRAEGEPAVEDGIAFTDVAAGQYYENAVKWASANGIVKGITETEFAPDKEVTREQMAAMIARYIEFKKVAVPEKDAAVYTDADAIADYAKDAVAIANKLGILIGNADGSFEPADNATRAEAATLFVRLLGTLTK